ncbi:PTS glucitol/sorbitol transporter subunit IIA [Brachybacterium phenoliresistens]|uniref:PTS glucitol/sorbitol transporter subunit IIA n=1 Tax=Brachybacterium phenoliresistens TaxID=396014 RepID=UPI0031D47EAB
MSDLYTSTVTSIGADAPSMFEAGVVILFAEPVPPALADVSVVHSPSGELARDIQAGDTISIGVAEYTVVRLGDVASNNLRELGHVVLYVDAGDQKLLPGAIHVDGPSPAPQSGARITVRGA